MRAGGTSLVHIRQCARRGRRSAAAGGDRKEPANRHRGETPAYRDDGQLLSFRDHQDQIRDLPRELEGVPPKALPPVGQARQIGAHRPQLEIHEHGRLGHMPELRHHRPDREPQGGRVLRTGLEPPLERDVDRFAGLGRPVLRYLLPLRVHGAHLRRAQQLLLRRPVALERLRLGLGGQQFSGGRCAGLKFVVRADLPLVSHGPRPAGHPSAAGVRRVEANGLCHLELPSLVDLDHPGVGPHVVRLQRLRDLHRGAAHRGLEQGARRSLREYQDYGRALRHLVAVDALRLRGGHRREELPRDHPAPHQHPLDTRSVVPPLLDLHRLGRLEHCHGHLRRAGHEAGEAGQGDDHHGPAGRGAGLRGRAQELLSEGGHRQERHDLLGGVQRAAEGHEGPCTLHDDGDRRSERRQRL
mmetsp:Transcript_23290/g.47162  ORF Transcript_23290/g.47162 Transcript_23290/m.47162 type:complete len:413 (+) Transcript_23290:69-1307(+)